MWRRKLFCVTIRFKCNNYRGREREGGRVCTHREKRKGVAASLKKIMTKHLGTYLIDDQAIAHILGLKQLKKASVKINPFFSK
jgi:hypothetical protein